MFIDNLLLQIQQDPIYFIIAIFLFMLLLATFAKSVFERIVDGIADYLTDETKSTEERAEEIVTKIAAGLDLAMDKVGKRKGLINFIKKVVLSQGTKKWLIKVMNKYPSLSESTSDK